MDIFYSIMIVLFILVIYEMVRSGKLMRFVKSVFGCSDVPKSVMIMISPKLIEGDKPAPPALVSPEAASDPDVERYTSDPPFKMESMSSDRASDMAIHRQKDRRTSSVRNGTSGRKLQVRN
jgi:hypothetical protein